MIYMLSKAFEVLDCEILTKIWALRAPTSILFKKPVMLAFAIEWFGEESLSLTKKSCNCLELDGFVVSDHLEHRLYVEALVTFEGAGKLQTFVLCTT